MARLFEECGSPDPNDLIEVKRRLLRRVRDFEDSRIEPGVFQSKASSYQNKLRFPALLSLVPLIIAILVWQNWSEPKVLAATLLKKSITAEQLPSDHQRFIVRRTFNLEERVTGKGAVTARRRIQIWQGMPAWSAGVVKARRVFDEKGLLLSGDWSFPSGARNLYRRGASPEKIAGEQNEFPIIPDTVEAASHVDISAGEFTALIRDPAMAEVEETASTHIVTYRRDRTAPGSTASPLVKTWLVLNKSNLRPIERGFVVTRNNEEREYRLSETSFDRYSMSASFAAVFQPDAELLGPPAATSVGRMAAAKIAEPVVEPIQKDPPVDAKLEIETIYLLGQANITLGDEANLERLADGSLAVAVVWRNELDREKLLRAMSPLFANPLLRFNLRMATSAPNAECGSEEPGRLIAARARRAAKHALALQIIGNRFSPEDLKDLDDTTRDKWLTMILRHVQAFEYEILSLRRDFSAQYPASPVGMVPSVTAVNDTNLSEMLAGLVKLGTGIDQRIVAWCVSDVDAGQRSTLQDEEFYQSLWKAERMAAAIRDAMTPGERRLEHH